ncbi:MAG: hypothetical protein QOH88_1473 [Verrucomicrobiota bacterium]
MAARVAILAAVLTLGLACPSSAGDNIEMTTAEYPKTVAMIRQWLALLDKGKYAESFTTASDSFRHDLTAENWAAKHSKMLEETGPVISRGKMGHLMTVGPVSHEKAPSYDADFKTKFKKKSGTEHVEIVKENGEWKVANYMIVPE